MTTRPGAIVKLLRVQIEKIPFQDLDLIQSSMGIRKPGQCIACRRCGVKCDHRGQAARRQNAFPRRFEYDATEQAGIPAIP